jgi:SAM-dependent methyltransferase
MWHGLGDASARQAPNLGKEKLKAMRLDRLYRRLRRPAWLGTLRRTTPLSDDYGFDRGTPVDRYYIELFLQRNRADIRGRVLEVKDSGYTQRFGNGLTEKAVLDVTPTNPLATIVADLAAADVIPTDSFDCFILTQTLQYIYDVRGALSHAHRILRTGGALLATVPAVGRISRTVGVNNDYWRFTKASCARLFGSVFGPDNVSVQSYGNVLVAIASLSGMAYQELSIRELSINDTNFPLLIAVRAFKPKA